MARSTAKNKTIILIYLPVLHAGYLEFLTKYAPDAKKLYIINPQWAQTLDQQLDYLRKEIRSLSPQQIQSITACLYPQLKSQIIDKRTIKEFRALVKQKDLRVITPDEDISQIVIDRFLPQAETHYSPVFLRWDKKRVDDIQPVKTKLQISQTEFDQTIIQRAFNLAGLSSDWWRHVGAVLIKDNKVLLESFNYHTPSPQTQYINGDPRSLASTGVAIEIGTSQHAEGSVLAEAVKQGIKTAGLALYVTTFPCPYCARLIATAGIKKLYFAEGYSVLDAQEELERANVKIIQVKVKASTRQLQDRRSITQRYPTS
ncbi:hypothetical protein KKF92_03705 [Patescibacteria group bacterium]|nr:hypothetical protein [Patescibacteria group bacterium]